MMLRYTIPTRVRSVDRITRLSSARKVGEDVLAVHDDLGWYVLLEGSHEHLYLGHEEPELRAGDLVRVTIERVGR
jgi:hypothetical protein